MDHRQMHLGVYAVGTGNHIAGWRLPEAYEDTGLSLARWIELAQIMERGKLDMLFIADSQGLAGVDDLETLSHNPRVSRFEPFTVLSALKLRAHSASTVACSSDGVNDPVLGTPRKPSRPTTTISAARAREK